MTKFLTVTAIALGVLAGSSAAYASPSSHFKGFPGWAQQAFTPPN